MIVDDNHCLQYVKRQCVSSEDVVFTIHITNKVLKSWQDFKAKGILLNFSFVKILNNFLAEKYAILVQKDCKRIEEGLRVKVKSGFKGKSGLHYVSFVNQSRSITTRAGDILRASDLEIELQNLDTPEKRNQNKDDNGMRYTATWFHTKIWKRLKRGIEGSSKQVIHEQNTKEITTVAVVLYLIKHMWIITKLLLRISRCIHSGVNMNI